MTRDLSSSETHRLQLLREAVRDYVEAYTVAGWCSSTESALRTYFAPHVVDITPAKVLAWLRAPHENGSGSERRERVRSMLHELQHAIAPSKGGSTLASRYAAAMLAYDVALRDIGAELAACDARSNEQGAHLAEEHEELQYLLIKPCQVISFEAHTDKVIVHAVKQRWEELGFVGEFSSDEDRRAWTSARAADGQETAISYSEACYLDTAIAEAFHVDFSNTDQREAWLLRRVARPDMRPPSQATTVDGAESVATTASGEGNGAESPTGEDAIAMVSQASVGARMSEAGVHSGTSDA